MTQHLWIPERPVTAAGVLPALTPSERVLYSGQRLS